MGSERHSAELEPVGIKECGPPAMRRNDAAKTVQSDSEEWRVPEPAALLLPVAGVRLLLHHGGRYRRRWAGHPHARAGVDYGDGVAGAQGRRLVELHLLAVVGLEAGDGVVGVVGCGGG